MEDEAGKIEVSWLDGSHRKVFLGEDIIWPNGLSIDDIGKRIYWCDSYLQRIESMSFTSKADRRLHLSHKVESRLSQPYGLTFHQETVYWSEFEKGHIMKLDLQTKNISLVLKVRFKFFNIITSESKKPRQIALVIYYCDLSLFFRLRR